MPPLDDTQPPILSPTGMLVYRPQRPSPPMQRLSLERISAKEAGYLGHVLSVDTPYWMIPTRFGEWEPVTSGPIPDGAVVGP